jgi:hypothetical protein
MCVPFSATPFSATEAIEADVLVAAISAGFAGGESHRHAGLRAVLRDDIQQEL